MKGRNFIIFLLLILLITGCSSTRYIFDEPSAERQRELKNSRNGAVAGEIFLASFNLFLAATMETSFEYYPSETRFRKIQLQNPTNDTLFVNMVTNIYWDKNDYCDFMDIRIPPQKNCRLLCPVDAEYNIYFRNRADREDDDMITINTAKSAMIKLESPAELVSQKK